MHGQKAPDKGITADGRGNLEGLLKDKTPIMQQVNVTIILTYST